jgi:hypothetical protein
MPTYKVQFEVPEDADPKVVDALKAAAKSLDNDVEGARTGAVDSYSLTVHVIPDAKEETV